MTGGGKPGTAPALAVAPPGTWVGEFVLLGAIWGASFLFTRGAVVDFGVLPTAAVRVFIAAACLVPLVRLRGLWPTFRRHWRMACLLGLLNSAIPFVCFAFALLSITTGSRASSTRRCRSSARWWRGCGWATGRAFRGGRAC